MKGKRTISAALERGATRLVRKSRWPRWSLRGMLLVITALGIWLGMQANWLRQRQAARAWIEAHETEGGWSRVDPKNVTVGGLPDRPAEAPWSLRLFGESRLVYIYLDKSKLSESDIARIDQLPVLFPEAKQVQIGEPGWMTCWPPADPPAFLRYPTRVIAGKVVNQPVDDSPPNSGATENR